MADLAKYDRLIAGGADPNTAAAQSGVAIGLGADGQLAPEVRLYAGAPKAPATVGAGSGQPYTPPARLSGQAAAGAQPAEDILFQRVRAAEGTARDPWLVYGGDKFVPSKEHPGEEARRPAIVDGKPVVTHAAGPGQWQPGTWNGNKPTFRERFGRDPDFSSLEDHKHMVFINAGKVYPGGEAKLRADIAAGRLDTSALTGQWAGFGGGGGGGGSGGAGGSRRMPGRLGGMGPMVPTTEGGISPIPTGDRLGRALGATDPQFSPPAAQTVQAAPAAAAPAPAPHIPALQPIAIPQAPNLQGGLRDALAMILGGGGRRPMGNLFGQ